MGINHEAGNMSDLYFDLISQNDSQEVIWDYCLEHGLCISGHIKYPLWFMWYSPSSYRRSSKTSDAYDTRSWSRSGSYGSSCSIAKDWTSVDKNMNRRSGG